MTHPIWPLFDIKVRTPRLELRAIDDEMGVELAELAVHGVHAPDFMPFTNAWTDAQPPELQRNTMQFYWRCRATWTPDDWNLNLAVIEGGTVVGSTGMFAKRFGVLRQFETGSWLGLAHQGRGIGTEMRIATLQLGFVGFDAHVATTAAFDDNGPSLGVTRRLGYQPNGIRRDVRRDTVARAHLFSMDRNQFDTTLRRDDIELIGAEACRPMVGLL